MKIVWNNLCHAGITFVRDDRNILSFRSAGEILNLPVSTKHCHFDQREKSSPSARNRNYSIRISMNELVSRFLGVFENFDQLVTVTRFERIIYHIELVPVTAHHIEDRLLVIQADITPHDWITRRDA